MSTVKKYKLLKDLPDGALIGDIYSKNGDRYHNERLDSTKSIIIEHNSYFAWQVENNPEWFSPVIEEQRIEISALGGHAFWINDDKPERWYQFKSSKLITQEKFKELSNLVEMFVNGDLDKSAPSVLNNDTVVEDKQVLFTTEDGVAIKSGQDYWHVVSDWTPQKETAQEFGRHEYQISNLLRFSTEEAANNYILYSKPCLSLKDIQWWVEKYFNVDAGGINMSHLEPFVKEKLSAK